MSHKTFQEYLDNKSKFSSKGKIEAKADTGPKPSAAPGKEKKHKDAGGEGQKGSPKPYKGGKDAKDPNKGKLGGGFADEGDKDLKYTPGDKEKGNFITGGKEASGVPGGKVVASDWNKTKTQEWLNRTKELSLAEFTKMIQKTTSKGIKTENLDECACQGIAAHDVIRQTLDLAKANESVLVTLVREMKRSKLFGKVVAEMLQHDETYGVLARFMEHDEKYARRLVRAMNEMVGPPAHKDDIDDDDPSKPPHPEDMHGDDDDDMDMDMDMGHGDDMGMGGDGDDPMMGHHGHDMGDDAMGGDMGMPTDDMGGDDPMGGGDDPTMGPHGHGGDPASDIAPHSKIMPAKKKKKHAHHHLMAALKDSPMGQDAGGMGAMGGGVGPV